VLFYIVAAALATFAMALCQAIDSFVHPLTAWCVCRALFQFGVLFQKQFYGICMKHAH
jgi:hypothetical protein